MARCLLLLAMLTFGMTQAWAQTGKSSFDHLNTGYALTGAHLTSRCESCHQNGVFKGTPRDCSSCHVSGARFAKGNVVMSTQHLPTSQACDSCHTTKAFGGIKFSHTQVQTGSCQVCHNGASAPGKTASHVVTTLPCDSCHSTKGFTPAKGMDHAGFTTYDTLYRARDVFGVRRAVVVTQREGRACSGTGFRSCSFSRPRHTATSRSAASSAARCLLKAWRDCAKPAVSAVSVSPGSSRRRSSKCRRVASDRARSRRSVASSFTWKSCNALVA